MQRRMYTYPFVDKVENAPDHDVDPPADLLRELLRREDALKVRRRYEDPPVVRIESRFRRNASARDGIAVLQLRRHRQVRVLLVRHLALGAVEAHVDEIQVKVVARHVLRVEVVRARLGAVSQRERRLELDADLPRRRVGARGVRIGGVVREEGVVPDVVDAVAEREEVATLFKHRKVIVVDVLQELDRRFRDVHGAGHVIPLVKAGRQVHRAVHAPHQLFDRHRLFPRVRKVSGRRVDRLVDRVGVAAVLLGVDVVHQHDQIVLVGRVLRVVDHRREPKQAYAGRQRVLAGRLQARRATRQRVEALGRVVLQVHQAHEALLVRVRVRRVGVAHEPVHREAQEQALGHVHRVLVFRLVDLRDRDDALERQTQVAARHAQHRHRVVRVGRRPDGLHRLQLRHEVAVVERLVSVRTERHQERVQHGATLFPLLVRFLFVLLLLLHVHRSSFLDVVQRRLQTRRRGAASSQEARLYLVRLVARLCLPQLRQHLILRRVRGGRSDSAQTLPSVRYTARIAHLLVLVVEKARRRRIALEIRTVEIVAVVVAVQATMDQGSGGRLFSRSLAMMRTTVAVVVTPSVTARAAASADAARAGAATPASADAAPARTSAPARADAAGRAARFARHADVRVAAVVGLGRGFATHDGSSARSSSFVRLTTHRVYKTRVSRRASFEFWAWSKHGSNS